MKKNSPLVVLVDVDTLLDNGRVQADLKKHIEREFGPQCRDRFWAIHEELFSDLLAYDLSDLLPGRAQSANDRRPSMTAPTLN
jgi:hypothetical protein